jgi:hypothetical protein
VPEHSLCLPSIARWWLVTLGVSPGRVEGRRSPRATRRRHRGPPLPVGGDSRGRFR